MTATNIFLKRDRAVLMTDAAVYTAQGLVIGFGQKAVAMPTLKAAVAVRSVQRTTGMLAMDMSVAFQTFDQFLASGEAYLDTIVPQLAEFLPEGLEHAQILIVGWSDERNGPVGVFYDTQAEDRFGAVDGYVMAPLPDDDEWRNLNLVGCDIDNNLKLSDFDPIRHGIPLMEAQRRMKIIPTAADMDEGIAIVGGHILLTEVTRDGVQQRVIHRWNDEAYENIQPEPFQATPKLSETTAGMSRQQRRAWEREKAKAIH